MMGEVDFFDRLMHESRTLILLELEARRAATRYPFFKNLGWSVRTSWRAYRCAHWLAQEARQGWRVACRCGFHPSHLASTTQSKETPS